jgi:glycosyltransferase involved in cell wall biosynthesis
MVPIRARDARAEPGSAAARGIAVSLTPVALDCDSRAFRIACALAETGFRSIVVEGRASRCRFWDERIEVRSLEQAGIARRPGAALRQGRLRDAVTLLRDGRFGRPGQAALYAGYRAYDWHRHCRLPRRTIAPAALYYLHSFEMHRAVAPLAARTGAPIIYDAHDFYRGIEPPEQQRPFDAQRLQPFQDRLERRLVALADAFVTVSDGVADAMATTFGRRPEVIRNCHDERCDRHHAPDLRAILGLGAEDRLCVVIGNYKAGMAVAVAAAALALLPERYHIAFVGRGYDAALPALPPALLGSRLHVGHAFPPDEVVPAVRSADLGLVLYEPRSTNYRYALPNGFFQAVAAGLPLVRAPLVEVERAIAGRAIGICLERLDAANLAAAVLRCAADTARLRAGAAALARELSWGIEAARLEALIDRVTGTRLAGAA